MTSDEKQMEIFHAASGCTLAAAEMLRSVNKPLNATNIAQSAWDIAKKLEEMMETAVLREKAGLAAATGSMLSAKGPDPVFKTPGKTDKPAERDDLLMLADEMPAASGQAKLA